VTFHTARAPALINAIAGGSLISWAVFREGTAERWVRGNLDTLLAPYKTTKAKRQRPKAK
jgi:hypothetical protein